MKNKKKNKKKKAPAAKKARAAAARRKADASEAALEHAYRQALHRFAHRPDVLGVTIGDKLRGGEVLEQTVIRIHVREKVAQSLLRPMEVFPEDIDGVPIDIVQRHYRTQIDRNERRFRKSRVLDPLRPGIGISRDEAVLGPGTLGFVAFDEETGAAGLVSAAHVIAGTALSTAGDPVLQPSRRNNGQNPQHVVARLAGFLFNVHGDAAFAPLQGPRRINPTPLGAPRRISGARRVRKGDILEKSGFVTGVTRGRVESIGVLEIFYEVLGKTLPMEVFEVRQISPDAPLSEEGDSGSLWYDPETGEGVGLHIAGEANAAQEEHALACHLLTVLDELDISLTPTEQTDLSLLTDEPAAVVPTS